MRLALPPLKVDAADDRRVGIWKAPLPGGTAGAKKYAVDIISCALFDSIYCIKLAVLHLYYIKGNTFFELHMLYNKYVVE